MVNKRGIFWILDIYYLFDGVNGLIIKVAVTKDMSIWKASVLILDHPYKYPIFPRI
jgi:hypothetical protein